MLYFASEPGYLDTVREKTEIPYTTRRQLKNRVGTSPILQFDTLLHSRLTRVFVRAIVQLPVKDTIIRAFRYHSLRCCEYSSVFSHFPYLCCIL